MSSKDDDKKLFEEAMKGVRPLQRKTGPALVAASGPPPPRPKPTAARRALAVVSREGEHYLLLAPDAARPRNDERPDGKVDLHGLDATRARAALRDFIDRARAQGWQRVLVIHGRGRRSGPEGPVLRDTVLDALLAPPLSERVLAATNAAPALGGLGAAVLLLRVSASGRRRGSG
jgi:DNA-nicking Smr family endonuclease